MDFAFPSADDGSRLHVYNASELLHYRFVSPAAEMILPRCVALDSTMVSDSYLEAAIRLTHEVSIPATTCQRCREARKPLANACVIRD